MKMLYVMNFVILDIVDMVIIVVLNMKKIHVLDQIVVEIVQKMMMVFCFVFFFFCYYLRVIGIIFIKKKKSQNFFQNRKIFDYVAHDLIDRPRSWLSIFAKFSRNIVELVCSRFSFFFYVTP